MKRSYWRLLFASFRAKLLGQPGNGERTTRTWSELRALRARRVGRLTEKWLEHSAISVGVGDLPAAVGGCGDGDSLIQRKKFCFGRAWLIRAVNLT